MKANRLIAGLLALLGFAACDININGRVEYGTPHASFQIKGRVTDEAGDPVKDIKVVVRDDEWDNPEYPLAVGITDNRGDYSIYGGWHGGRELSVSTEDIDGEKNGGDFAPETKVVKIESSDYVGGDGWDRGTVTKTADFTLELKQQENESE